MTTPDDIKFIVCQHFGLDPCKLLLKNKTDERTYIRAMVVFLIWKQLGMSVVKIGIEMQRTRNATYAALNRIKGELTYCREVKDDVGILTDKILDWEERTATVALVH